MGFISYSIKFFNSRLNFYETNYPLNASQKIIHEAKILLKFLEDIKDEGYLNSYDFINQKTNEIKRLNSFILKNNEIPFAMKKFTIKSDLKYKNEQDDLNKYLTYLKNQMDLYTATSPPEIFYDILNYSRNIFEPADLNTAYCFLLRDSLLPYLAFDKWNSNCKFKISPLFISRKYLSFLDDDIYIEIQNIIFAALDSGIKNFYELKTYVKNEIKSKRNFDKLIQSLKNLLSDIKQGKIMIIESGYIGTIPMLLSSIDNRIDFKLFSTIPYFYDVYKGKFFTDEFQKMRLFETIQCQDALFKLSSIDGKNINICETENDSVKKIAFSELATWNKLISKK